MEHKNEPAKATYTVTGMSCAACVARVEKAVRGVEGVSDCAVSLLTNSMSVTGTAAPEAVVRAVADAGYAAAERKSAARGEEKGADSDENLSFAADITSLKRRLAVSLAFLAALMYVSMGHMMFGFPLPPWFDGNHVAMGLVQLLLSAVILAANRQFFVNGFKTLLHLSPTMDTLVALGAGVSFAYSTAMLFGMTDSVLKGDDELTMYFMENFYFEGAATIVALITVGKLLEAISKGRTTDALKTLVKIAPKTAVIIVGGEEKEVPVSEIAIGDTFIVRPGMQIPTDGDVVEGASAVDESALTGESVPADKEAGSKVFQGTMNTNGFLTCRASRVGSDTALSRIIQMVSDAAATKAPIAKVADRVSAVFVPSVIALSLVTLAVWVLLGKAFGFALSRAICVLVVSCPCALGLATPVAIMVGNGVGARNGILFKTSAALENAGRTRIVALDKTGTITSGNMRVASVCGPDFSASDGNSLGSPALARLVQSALTLEKPSEHPLAAAVVRFAEEKGFRAEAADDFEAVGGRGVRSQKRGTFGGNIAFISENCALGEEVLSALREKVEEEASLGQTPLIFATRTALLGIISVSDTVKDDSRMAIGEFRSLGIRTVMLTGDNETTARAVARQTGVDEVVAGVLPDGKESAVKRLMQEGKTAMVGDGINDAPALNAADTGIAIGAGTDVAIDSADIVLMNSSLMDAVTAVKLSRLTLRNIRQNLFWAFFYNVALIPVAAGVYAHFGLTMNPMLGAAAMSLSSFCVVANALRLNFANIAGKNADGTGTAEQTTEEKMTKTIKVNGMMCQHCEAHVRSSLEKIGGVESAQASHETGKVVLELSADVDAELLKKAVADAGYEFAG